MPDLGDIIPLTVEIRDAAGVLANATAVVLTVTLPDGTTATPTVSNPSTGRYQADYAATQVGRHVARWTATGLNSSAYVDTFDVRPADPGYILSLAAAKAAINRPAADTADDEEIRSLIEAVTHVVEDMRGEAIVRRAVVERFATRGHRRILLGTTPVLSLTSATRTVDGYVWSPTDATLTDPALGEISTGLYAPPFYGELTVAYVAGRAVVPANYVEAAKIIFRHLWQTQQAPNLGPRPFAADDTSITPAGFAIPNRAAELLGPRPPMVA